MTGAATRSAHSAPAVTPTTQGVGDELPRSWAEVYEEHADFVWRGVQRMGLSPDDAKDALHDVFLVVHQRIASFDRERGSLRAWLLGIAANVVRAERRRKRPLPTEGVEGGEAAGRGPSHRTENTTMGASSLRAGDGPGSQHQRGLAIAIQRALDALDPEKRAVFTMFELEGMSCAAIAQELSVPTGTVYSRLHHARSSLQKALAAAHSQAEEDGA